MHLISRFLNGLTALLTIAAASASLTLHAFTPTEDGLYAVFNTNLGTFAAKLHYDKAPLTVANFVALAEGTQPWLDFNNGTIHKRPYYNGLTFHRVISGFMIQSGSRSGDGTDGPGYYFPDEMHPDLLHSKAGTLSMANSGPNSNGAQFFVTLAAPSHLNHKHSVFGEVVEGMSTVSSIGAVATNSDDLPLSPVIIENVQILRQGQQANDFNTASWPIPEITSLRPYTVQNAGKFELRVPQSSQSDSLLFSSSNGLETWQILTEWAEPTENPNPPFLYTNLDAASIGQNGLFYRAAKVPYARTVNKTNAKVEIKWEFDDLNIAFSDNSTGTYTFGTADGGEVTFYRWFDLGGRAQLAVIFSDLTPAVAQLYLTFDTPTSGTLLAYFLQGSTNNPFSVRGTFTYYPAP